VIFTRLAWVLCLVLLAFLCWLGIRGLTIVVPFLVTAFVLLLLIGGGNVISGRSSPRAGGRSGEPGREER
jgi:hypothetical protein